MGLSFWRRFSVVVLFLAFFSVASEGKSSPENLIQERIDQITLEDPVYGEVIQSFLNELTSDASLSVTERRDRQVILGFFSDVNFQKPSGLLQFYRNALDSAAGFPELADWIHRLTYEQISFQWNRFLSQESEASYPFGFESHQLKEFFELLSQNFIVEQRATPSTLEGVIDPPLLYPGRIREILLPIYLETLNSATNVKEYLQWAELEFPDRPAWQGFQALAIRLSLDSFSRLQPGASEASQLLHQILKTDKVGEESLHLRARAIQRLETSASPRERKMAKILSSLPSDLESSFFLSLLFSRTKFETVEEMLDFYNQELGAHFSRLSVDGAEEAFALFFLHWMSQGEQLTTANFLQTRKYLSLPFQAFSLWSQRSEATGEAIAQVVEANLHREVREHLRGQIRSAAQKVQSPVELAFVLQFTPIPSKDFEGLKFHVFLENMDRMVSLSRGFMDDARFLSGVPGLSESQVFEAAKKIDQVDSHELTKFALLVKAMEEKLSSDVLARERLQAYLTHYLVERFAQGVRIKASDEKQTSQQREEISMRVLSLLPSQFQNRVRYREATQTFQSSPSLCGRILGALSEVYPQKFFVTR